MFIVQFSNKDLSAFLLCQFHSVQCQPHDLQVMWHNKDIYTLTTVTTSSVSQVHFDIWVRQKNLN